MANFSALKQSIQNYIKQNGNKEITGNLLQEILLSMVTTMGDGAINENESDISDEINRAKGAETTTILFSDGKLVFKNAAGTVLYQLSVDSFLNALTTRLNTGALYAGYATPSTTPAALTSQEVFYLATQAGTYTNFHFNGGDDPIVLTKDGIYFIVSGLDDDDWNAETMLQLDDVPIASSNNAVKSGGVAEELALGAVYDVSAKNPTAGPNNDGKWESLSALFSDANLSTLIPASVRKGGMSIKFVQSSDNKYVRYNLLADSFTTDTTQWAIDDEGVYIESPEYVYALVGRNKEIIIAVKANGDCYFGAGVPQQVIDFVIDRLSYKVDKVSGKSLIDQIFANSVSVVESPEFVDVEMDSENKIVSYRDKDGIKHECGGFETSYIKSEEIILSEGGLKKLSKSLAALKPINRLPCLPQEIVDATGNDFVTNRCQNCLVAHKSFKPLLDFRGRLAHKTVTDAQWNYNLSSEILFEERFTLRLDTGNPGSSRIYTKHSDDLKHWVTESAGGRFGEWAYIHSESDACYGNDNSLLMTIEVVQYYDGGVLKTAILPLWSLDGGLHFEPLINNYRGHFSIANNILSEGTIVTIGAKTYTCISSSDANTAMESLVGDNTDELVAAGLEYLADKIVLSTNPQDALRMLAWHLVDEGYFVRLEDEELIVYSKTIGTAGNIQSDISIGSTTYTFASGQDYTTPQLVDAAQILPATLPVTHADGSTITSNQAWTYMSMLYVNGIWYMAIDMHSTTMTTNIVVKITDITGAINTSTYKVLMSQPLSYNTEPLLTYDKVHNIIFVGFRDDGTSKTRVIKYMYSTDGGDNYNLFTIENPSDNLSWKYNTKIFLAEPPNIFKGSSINEGYNFPNKTDNLIYVSVVYCRMTGIAWVATADIPTEFDKDVTKLEWSEYKPLNHFIPKDEKDYRPVLGDFPDYRLRCYDAGMGSIGAMVYSRLHKGIVVGYHGMKVIGKTPSNCMGVAIEHC